MSEHEYIYNDEGKIIGIVDWDETPDREEEEEEWPVKERTT